MASALSRCYDAQEATRNMDVDLSLAYQEDRPALGGENFTLGASEAKRRGITRTTSAPMQNPLRNITNNHSSASGTKKLGVQQRPPKPVVVPKRPLPPNSTAAWVAPVAPQKTAEDSDNIQLVSEYAADIHAFLLSEETARLPSPTYMDTQPDINSRMRAILVDWLVEVHSKYRLHDETLWLCVQIVDRYLETANVMRNRLQLVGVAAMLIAAKFEEIHPPEVRDFAYITDNTYSKQEILDMEAVILNSLEFNLACPTAVHFLSKFQRANQGTEVHKHLAQYLAELSLPDHRSLKYRPSLVAAAAVLLSNRLMSRRAPAQQLWAPHMIRLTQLDEEALLPCIEELQALYNVQANPPTAAAAGNGTNAPLTAVKKKFQSAKYSTVSCLALA